MKNLYKKLKKIKDSVKGECEILIETSYNTSPGMTISICWNIYNHYRLGTLQQYFSEEELEQLTDKVLDKFINEANEYYDNYNTYKP
jgi:hypothetical protein